MSSQCKCGFRAPELGPHPECVPHGNPGEQAEGSLPGEKHEILHHMDDVVRSINAYGLDELTKEELDELALAAETVLIEVVQHERELRRRG